MQRLRGFLVHLWPIAIVSVVAYPIAKASNVAPAMTMVYSALVATHMAAAGVIIFRRILAMRASLVLPHLVYILSQCFGYMLLALVAGGQVDLGAHLWLFVWSGLIMLGAMAHLAIYGFRQTIDLQ